MKTHDLIPGSPAWHAFRLEHGGASEAAAMLGMDPLVSRSALLRAKHTTLAREFSDWLQARVIDKGHEVEALARPHAEAFIGEELFPAVISDGYPSASMDGITIDDRIVWEHKQWSEERAACLRAGRLPDKDMPQVQQVTMLSGAERCLFTVSDGTPEKMLHLWVDPDPAWFQRLRDGWAQFERDLAAYELPPAAEPITAAPVESLPALAVRMDGALVVRSNLSSFGVALRAFIERIPKEPSTDQEFADTEAACKILKRAEDELDASEAGALASIADVEVMRRLVRDYRNLSRETRLLKEKAVDRRKTEIKERAIVKARKALDEHIARLNAEIAPIRLGPVDADFAAAIKGLRTVASMQDRLDVVLSGAKIAADIDARSIRANLAVFAAEAVAPGYVYLFTDLSQIVHKPAEDFVLTLRSRIDAHKAAEAAKERQRAEAEAQRVAAAEQRAREQEAARIEAERLRELQATMRQAEEMVQKVAGIPEGQHPQQVLKAEPAMADATDRGIAANMSPRGGAMGAGQAAAAAPVANEPATLALGTICGRLGFTVSGDFLRETLHVAPAKTDRRSLLYTESQFATICRQLVSHVGAMAELYAGETA